MVTVLISFLMLMIQDLCVLRGCCWDPQRETHLPWCYFSKNHGYQVQGRMSDTNPGKQKKPKLQTYSIFIGTA